MDKKRDLMKQAVHLFSIKGFHQTSVNEIAQASGISKGAFYKHFDSKESLFIDIIKQYHEEIISETSSMNFSDQLNPLEVFSQKISIEIERVLANKEFFLMVFKDFPPGENEQIERLFHELQVSTMRFHQKSIIEAFGSQAEPFLTDLATVLGGMLREYLITLIFENKQVSPRKLSAFIAGSLDAIVLHLDRLEPVLSGEPIQLNQKEEILNEIKAKIQTFGAEKEKLLLSLNLLVKELNKKEPQTFLVEAMLVYLQQEPQLEYDINRLEKFV
ncbi:TetR/AcrR family transcriptional regulator [Planococcus sp. N028]|uniref:TetR/AcrR family transcriptional regulator n=1 Tax=Planococcus shixiaomingii TaxID=3058393 RepID=A0ABT8N1L6_9BACL|nr:TetR/AcrR family transcriptional regulator [Planococcus sp. N028]MDN7241594.1 TetR/AcrR family transcriptional regulator [Planococcus sp. N028]